MKWNEIREWPARSRTWNTFPRPTNSTPRSPPPPTHNNQNLEHEAGMSWLQNLQRRIFNITLKKEIWLGLVGQVCGGRRFSEREKNLHFPFVPFPFLVSLFSTTVLEVRWLAPLTVGYRFPYWDFPVFQVKRNWNQVNPTHFDTSLPTMNWNFKEFDTDMVLGRREPRRHKPPGDDHSDLNPPIPLSQKWLDCPTFPFQIDEWC